MVKITGKGRDRYLHRYIDTEKYKNRNRDRNRYNDGCRVRDRNRGKNGIYIEIN